MLVSGNNYQFEFSVSNPSTWESATRLRIDNDNDENHDGIFSNKTRGNGIHFEGNLTRIGVGQK